MDGLVEAIRRNVKRIYAFTNSQILFDQVSQFFVDYCMIITFIYSKAYAGLLNLLGPQADSKIGALFVIKKRILLCLGSKHVVI
ncbi:hypothetical protein Hanom_Chr03g00266501 [Helianthus anomalus]